MAMSGGSNGTETMADINVTPLVDVMLVLLIIFMVTAPMLDNAGVDVDLPKEQAAPLEMDDEEQLIITMDADLNVYLGDLDTPFAIGELPDRLTAIAEANPDRPIFLRADGEVPYRAIAKLLAVAKSAGMPRVGLVFDPISDADER
ncbi:MAG: ExbD/TolR family protein [Myxococcota bacterium]